MSTHVRFPSLGQAREDLGPGVRCFVVKPYVTFYRQAEDTIEVLRVLHGAHDIGGLIEPAI